MERLTERFSNGQAAVAGCGSQCKHGFVYCEDLPDEVECAREWVSCPTINEILDKLAYYEDLEEKLEKAYGKCDGLLETAINSLVRHEGVEIGTPAKSMLLTDEDVDKWLTWKNAEEQELLLILPCKIGDTIYYIFGIPKKTPCIIESSKFELSDIDKIGTKFFLTEEAAEQALTEMEKENG